MKVQIARREFLKTAGRSLAALGVGSAVYNGTLFQLMQKAYAQSTGMTLNPTGYYVHLSLPGGPPRWFFDLPLTPHGLTSSNFVPGGFGTRLERGASGWSAVYQPEKFTAAGKTLYLPPVWGMGVARPFTEILPHTAFIRGMDNEINNHTLGNSRQVSPIVGGYSITGVVAGGAKRPIPGIMDPGSPAGTAFKSKNGLSPTLTSYTENATTNPIGTLLSPFRPFMTGRSVHDPASAPLQEQALKAFESYAVARGLSSSALPGMYDNAMELVAQDVFSRLNSLWSPTVAKYRALMRQALSPSKGQLPGIYDQTIAADSSNLFRYANLTTGKVALSDVRDMVTADLDPGRMAENFAIAEILLDEVTATMSLAFRPMANLESGHGKFTLDHDQHFVGAVVSTMMTTLFYRSFLACLTEFVARLKVKGIFNRTILHIGAEFSRTPRIDGSGSDHGFLGSGTTLISGMIGRPSVIGNVKKAGDGGIYQGTYGLAAPFVSDGFNRPIQVNDVARTITAMLGADDVVTNGRALLAPVGGLWVPKKDEANNV